MLTLVYVFQLVDALTTVRSVNRTDAMTLLSTFGSLEKVIEASEEEVALCPGFGPQKATRLHKVLHQHFRKPQHQKTNTKLLSTSSTPTQSKNNEQEQCAQKISSQ